MARCISGMVASTTENTRRGAGLAVEGWGLLEGERLVWAVRSNDEATTSAGATTTGGNLFMRAHVSCSTRAHHSCWGSNPRQDRTRPQRRGKRRGSLFGEIS